MSGLQICKTLFPVAAQEDGIEVGSADNVVTDAVPVVQAPHQILQE